MPFNPFAEVIDESKDPDLIRKAGAGTPSKD
ncbi:hypothetical protein BH10PLA2_BH10PLA2_15320 [soil metagenome]